MIENIKEYILLIEKLTFLYAWHCENKIISRSPLSFSMRDSKEPEPATLSRPHCTVYTRAVCYGHSFPVVEYLRF